MTWKSPGLYNAPWTESIYSFVVPTPAPVPGEDQGRWQWFTLNGDDIPGETTVLFLLQALTLLPALKLWTYSLRTVGRLNDPRECMFKFRSPWLSKMAHTLSARPVEDPWEGLLLFLNNSRAPTQAGIAKPKMQNCFVRLARIWMARCLKLWWSLNHSSSNWVTGSTCCQWKRENSRKSNLCGLSGAVKEGSRKGEREIETLTQLARGNTHQNRKQECRSVKTPLMASPHLAQRFQLP